MNDNVVLRLAGLDRLAKKLFQECAGEREEGEE